MRRRTITTWALGLTLGLGLGTAAHADPTPKPEGKARAAKTGTSKTTAKPASKTAGKNEATGPVKAWGVTWQPSVAAALEKAQGTDRTSARTTSKNRRSSAAGSRRRVPAAAQQGKPVLWMRVLGALTGDT